ncbi:MAG: hypothetical protein NC548_47570 [Lachnospiraceae bacterium]|nr:hypothetical protein [Lachnospiraceae bacterium]
MKFDKTIKIDNLIQGKVYYDLRHAIYWPHGISPAMTAAMGMGGGFVPLLAIIRDENGQSCSDNEPNGEQKVRQSSMRPGVLC